MQKRIDRLLDQIQINLPCKIAIIVVSLSVLILFGNGFAEKIGPLLAYLYGSIPFAYIVTKRRTGKEIFKEGSTSVGMANSYNVGGMVPAIVTVVGEISKAVIPIAISHFFFESSLTLTCALLVGCYLGTNFSIFLKGQGGMGTTMMLWSILFLSPFSLLAILGFMIASMLIVKDTYYMALLNYAVGPFLVFFIDGRMTLVAFVAFAAILYLAKLKRHMDDFAVHRSMRLRRKEPA